MKKNFFLIAGWSFRLKFLKGSKLKSGMKKKILETDYIESRSTHIFFRFYSNPNYFYIWKLKWIEMYPKSIDIPVLHKKVYF